MLYLGSSLFTLEGPVRAVDWVMRVAAGGDSGHSMWSLLFPCADEQTASAFAVDSLE